MPRIIVKDNYCKGCGLCLDVCPRDLIEMASDTLTAKGYHPARLIDGGIERCTACAICATMCPDVAITVLKEESPHA